MRCIKGPILFSGPDRFRRGVQHDVSSGIVFGEGYAVADAFVAAKKGTPTIQTKGYAAVWRSSVTEGFYDEGKFGIQSLL